MNSFEDEVLKHIDSIEQAKRNDERLIKAQADSEAKRVRLDEEQKGQALRVGQEAVSLLVHRGIDGERVWQNVVIGYKSGRYFSPSSGASFNTSDPVTKLHEAGYAWDILHLGIRRHDDQPPDIDRYCLKQDGVLQKFTHKNASGIHNPLDISGEKFLMIVQSDAFRKGVASLIAGYGAYKDIK